jgi:hypothetical protein
MLETNGSLQIICNAKHQAQTPPKNAETVQIKGVNLDLHQSMLSSSLRDPSLCQAFRPPRYRFLHPQLWTTVTRSTGFVNHCR